MKRGVVAASFVGVGLVLLFVIGILAACGSSEDQPAEAQSPTDTPPPLPGRATETPPPAAATFANRTPLPTPLVTSPFTFPTTPPEQSPTPSLDCTTVFPLDNVEAIDFNHTTISQLEASFGQADYRGGRPLTFRFEDGGCILDVEIAGQFAQAAELVGYGTLDLLLERYGEPEVVGIAEGNLTLMLVDSVVLLYPEQGVIAIFEDVAPDELTHTTPISRLQVRSAYEADNQITRLNLNPVTWQPPLR
jgi:hypothetical protein